MAKKVTKATKTAATAKNSAAKKTSPATNKKELTQMNLDNAEAAIKRETLYKYPADCLTKDQKKAFRRVTRSKLRGYIKQVNALKQNTDKDSKAKFKQIEQDLTDFRQQVLTDPIKSKV